MPTTTTRVIRSWRRVDRLAFQQAIHDRALGRPLRHKVLRNCSRCTSLSSGAWPMSSLRSVYDSRPSTTAVAMVRRRLPVYSPYVSRSSNGNTGTRTPAKTGKLGSTRYTRSTPTSRLTRPSTGRTVFHATATIHLSCGSRYSSFLDVKTAMSRCSLHLTPLTRF